MSVGNYNGFFIMDSMIDDEEFPLKGFLPVTSKYKITPHAQTSTAGLFSLVLPLRTYGDIYLKVPQSTYGLNWSATPLIPKSAIFNTLEFLILP